MDDLIIGNENSRPGAKPAVEAALAADEARTPNGFNGADAAAIRGVLFDERRSSSPVIEVDALNVIYGDFHAVKDLSFHVERGELYALLGTNGAGKTSALEVIEGHRRASSGTVRVFDRSPTDRRRVRPRMGMMLQESGFSHDLSVSESVGLIGRLSGRSDTVERVLEVVDLRGKAHTRVSQPPPCTDDPTCSSSTSPPLAWTSSLATPFGPPWNSCARKAPASS